MRVRLLMVAACLGSAALLQGAQLADPFAAGRPFVRSFRDRDGLPQNTVHALLIDRQGYLWAGTQDGAARYDGRQWRRFDLPNRGRSNFVRAMLESEDGSLWFGTQAGGLARLRDGDWTSYEPGSSGLPGSRVNVLAETAMADGSRALWIGTFANGLVRFDGDTWTTYGSAAGLPNSEVWALLPALEMGEPVLWIGTGAGPARLRLADGSIDVPAGAPHASISSLIETVAADGQRTIWMGTYGEGLVAFSGGGFRSLREREGLPGLFLTDLAPSPSLGGEAFWIALDGGGLALHRDGKIDAVDLAPELSSRAVYTILETTSDQGARAVWLGTRNNGLIRMSRGYWRRYQPFPETPDVPVAAILETETPDGSRELWLGTDGYGLTVWRKGVWERIDAQSGAIGRDSVTALAETDELPGEHLLWVGTRNGGLSSFDGRRWRRHDTASGALPGDLVQALLEGSDGSGPRLWVGTRTGLASFDGRGWHRPVAEARCPEDSILALRDEVMRNGDRRLWIGSASGLYLSERGRCREVAAADRLPNPAVQALYVQTEPDGARTLWIGTDGGGVALLDLEAPEARPQALSQRGPEVPNGTIYSIFGDREGRIYLLTNLGVTRLTPPGVGATWRQEEFTSEQGLPLNQGNRGASFVDADGHLWVGTVGGAAAFDAEHEPVDRTPKRLDLEASLARCETCPVRPRSVLAHDRGDIVFRYSLLSFFAESLTRYRTELVGHDPQPSGWSPVAQREVTALAPGAYTFRVWGRDSEGNIAGPRELEFVIRPALWQTATARFVMLAALALLIWIVLRLRTRVHERRERELRDLVEAKTRRLQRANSLLVELSYVDALTSVPNRRRFDELFEEEWKRAVRSTVPLGLVLVDIDAFKAYNDEFGHREGDECLRLVASVLADGLARSGDTIARYGGEEFAVVLPSTDAVGTVQVAEQLRRRVESQCAVRPGGARRQITVSCGVSAVTPAVGQEPGELFQRADEALYRAKRAGGNLSVSG